jgi:hypothetical protein
MGFRELGVVEVREVLREQIWAWVAGGERDGVLHEPLSIVKIEQLLARRGVRVPYWTLHRFAVERCGFRTAGAPGSASPTASPAWSASSTSPSSACSLIRRPSGHVGCTR